MLSCSRITRESERPVAVGRKRERERESERDKLSMMMMGRLNRCRCRDKNAISKNSISDKHLKKKSYNAVC